MKNAFEYEAELAELQAALAEEKKWREAAEGGWREANKVIAMQREKLDSLEAEIERLKGGQGEPVAYADPQSFENFKNHAHKGGLWSHEWVWAKPDSRMVPLYTSNPAPVSVVQQCKIGIYGKAFDTPETKRAYTYAEQPDNIAASKMGKAASYASPGGDRIDHGLSLLKALADEGFGVFEIDKVKEMNQ